MFNKLRQQIVNLIQPKAENSMSLPNQYLRYGSKVMNPDWTQVVMSDEDLYTGYSFAAIRNRATFVARIALENVTTESTDESQDFEHPHLQAISKSPTFSDYQFWYTISTYLDLEGWFPLLAIRNYNGSRYGAIKEFKLLSPYQVRRVVKVNDETGAITVGGYVESRKGYIRELPAEMMIDIRELNPFDSDKPFSMSDAAKESQFTLKTAGDYTRHSLKHNINAPGIMTTDVVLPDTDFANFVARVKNNVKGEPIFGNGKGAIDWKDMNIDLSKASLKEINELNRESLSAVYGVSKTVLGIEQSGTTRETAKVQKDLLIEGQVLPRIQLIIDSLNQDYRNNYANEYSTNEAEIIVSNPTATDHEAEIKDVEAKQKQSELYNTLLDKGYSPRKVADYIEGKITIADLGKPKAPKPAEPPTPPEETEEQLHIHYAPAVVEKKNEVDNESGLVQSQESLLKNAVINIDQHLVGDAIVRISKKIKNDITVSEDDLITKSEKNQYIDELIAVLVVFYGVIMQFQGGKSMRRRMTELAMTGNFTLDQTTRKYIKKISEKVADSHINTVIDDILVTAREAALQGKGQAEIIREIKKKYDQTVSETRAKAIARTETNRAFTRAQYEADRQFIKQNKLSKRAYKRWKTRSDNPCDFCKSLANGKLIPFSTAFAKLGDDIEVDGKVLPVNFEALEAGNAHTNCSCIYELVILEE